MLPNPAAPGLIPCSTEVFSEEKIPEAAVVNQWLCFKESGQWLETVDQTHLVIATGKLVLKNKIVGSNGNDQSNLLGIV